MRRTAKFVSAATVILLMTGSAIAAPLVSIDPGSIDICEGEFTVDVIINDEVLGLTGFDLLIDFDEAVLGYVLAVEGQLVLDYPGTHFFYETVEGTTSNALLINCAVLGGSIDGPGVLCSVTFECLSDGLSDLEFASVDFRDIDNLPIAVTHEDAEVYVSDDVVVFIDPASDVEPIDIPFDLKVVIGGGITYIDQLDLTVSFDHAVLEYQSAVIGDNVPSGSTFTATPGTGAVDIELDVNGSMSGVEPVAVLTFKGVSEATNSPVTLSGVVLGTETGTVIDPCIEGSLVTITGGSPVEQVRWGLLKSLYR